MNKKAVYGIIIAILIPLTGYLIIRSFSDRNIKMPGHFIYDSVINKTVNGKQQTDTLWHKIPEFSLTNQLGQQVGFKDMEGKVVVADFFFTRCPTICPQMTHNMKALQNGISSGSKVNNVAAEYVQFLSFSVDPERDSVKDLKKWADRFEINPGNWWLLTGSKKEIYDLSFNHFKLGVVDGKGIDTGFFHTDFVVLLDKYRNIRGYYHGLDTMDMKRLSRDVVLLHLEKDPARKKFYEGKLELLVIVFFITFVGIALLMYFLKREKP